MPRWLLPVVCAFAAAVPNSIAPHNDATCDEKVQELENKLQALKEENQALKARALKAYADNEGGGVKHSEASASPTPEPDDTEPEICWIDRLTLSLYNVTTIYLYNFTKCPESYTYGTSSLPASSS